MGFLANESRRRRENFQDLALDLKEKPIENRVSDVKNLSFFSPAALLYHIAFDIVIQ